MSEDAKAAIIIICIVLFIVALFVIPIWGLQNAHDIRKCRDNGYADYIRWNGTKMCIVIRDGNFEVLPMDKLEKDANAE